MATKKPSRPFYEVFLERVIRIDAVQDERAAVTEQDAADFFELGRIPGRADFLWPLEDPEPQGSIVLGVLGARGFTPWQTEAMSPPIQRAWDAAVAEWRKFSAPLRTGELIANGVHPLTGERRDLDPVEWSRAGLILDARNGDLLEKERSKRKFTERWLSITLRPAELKLEIKPGVIDWEDWWKLEVGRRDRGELPPEKSYLSDAEPKIKERYGVNHVPESSLRRLKSALYRGDVERPKR